MSHIKQLSAALCAILLAAACTQEAAAQYASSVISFSPGTGPTPGFSNPAAALGSPERMTGEGVYPGAVTPFNAPWGADELVSIGADGHITLKFSNYVLPRSGPEIGVFENAGFVFNFENGGTTAGPTTFSEDPAIVEVSADGLSWISLGSTMFNIPSNGYLDASDAFATTGSVPSDFRQPFTGSLSDFDNKTWPEVLDVLDGSGGGTWLDISATGLPRVGYIRFSVSSGNFELEAVSIANGAMGGVVPEPTAAALSVMGMLLTALGRRRSR